MSKFFFRCDIILGGDTMLILKNLQVKINDKIILKDINLNINKGEIHTLMGPNGVGKSTLGKVIMGLSNYEVKGSIEFNKQIIDDLNVTERSRLGIFLLDQNPIAIEGVTNAEMLRMVTSQTKEYEPIFDFYDRLKKICQKIDLDETFINRHINEGMSGGERKKNELLHMYVLEPSLIIFDEIDSGLDVDSLKTVCKAINEYLKTHEASALIITHHQNILKYIKPHYVHILKEGSIVKSGDATLAHKIENDGFEGI